ncbi:IGS10 protein, partial [Origma solitaria]|nr:IGS10 protein [Origma solitaria]
EDGRIVVLQSGVLTLRTADTFDTGLYHCISTNHKDADTLTFRITVVDPHVEHNGVNGAQLSTALGSTLHLPCTSTAAPDAAITWVLPEHVILHQSVGNKHIFANGTLRIRGVTEQDVGYFQCVAANQYGADLLVFQVLMRQDETALQKQHGAEGEWEEGSGNALLGSAAAQRHPSATAATLRAHGESAAPASSSRGAQSVRQRNSHRKMLPWPYGGRTGRQFRAHRRQFVSSGRKADPQRWAALLEKTKRNSTVADKCGDVITEPPIQVHKLSEVPEDEEETSGDLIPQEEEFMIPATERSPVFALGRATELTITAAPEEAVNHTPDRKTSLLLTGALTPLPSPPPHAVASGSRKPHTYPNPIDSWERSDLSQISANGVKQATISSGASGTPTVFPAGRRTVYSGESNNQRQQSAPMTPTTEATDASKAVTPQNTADQSHIFTESIDKVSTKTDHQGPVVTASAPSPEFGPIYFHSAQKEGTPMPPLASAVDTHQQIRVVQDVPTHPRQLQKHYGRRRKISGRRRMVRPGRIPSVREHQHNFGRPGSARGSTAMAAGVQLNMDYVPNVPALNILSSSINPFSPEAPHSSPSTMKMPLEPPMGTHQNIGAPHGYPSKHSLRGEENKHSARQKAAATVMSVTAKGTATAAANALGVMGLKPTVTPVFTPQTDTRVTKTKIFRVGGRRGQRRKRPPKTSAPERVTAAQSPAATPAVSTATPTVTAATSPAVSPSLTPAEPLPGSINTFSVTKAPALWVSDTLEPPRHRTTAATQTLASPVTQRKTQPAMSLPGRPSAQSPTMALQTTPVTQRNTQLATSPPASPAQTPTVGLQTSPWLDKARGGMSAQPATVGATAGPGPAQHIRATAAAGEKSYLEMGEGVFPENQAAQRTFPARTVPSAPAAVTAPSTRHPSPLP